MRGDLIPTKIYLEQDGRDHQLRVTMTNTKNGYVVVDRKRIGSAPATQIEKLRAKAKKFAKTYGIQFEDLTRGPRDDNAHGAPERDERRGAEGPGGRGD